ncbi:MAG: SH3 domain-containing protein, partial [Gemmobacter sp.]|nr:SH3 domain-containing protein [Gemmobacter sp.]
MIRLAMICLCLSAAPAVAEPFPATYEVRDVAANDVLNIRAQPRADAALIATLPPFAINIEVLETSEDRRWGLVSTGEGNGWVSMRYLNHTIWPDPYTVPRPLTCLGTEPFWSVALLPRGA